MLSTDNALGPLLRFSRIAQLVVPKSSLKMPIEMLPTIRLLIDCMLPNIFACWGQNLHTVLV